MTIRWFGGLLAFALPILAAGAADAAVTCDQAAARIRKQGYSIQSRECGGPVHTFSTLKGEAVLIKVDARTGRTRKLLGGD